MATDGEPPRTDVGFRVTEATAGALTVSEPLVETLDAVAVMFAVKFAVVGVVVAVKVAEFVPAAIVTEAGICTPALSLERLTTRAETTLPLRVTVPVEEAPPAIDAGRKLTEEGVGCRIGSVVDKLTPNAEAVMCAVKREVTGAMVRANVPVVEPEGTTTEAGTVAVALKSEESPTVNPEGGAGALIVTVPVQVPPPPTGFGLTEKPVSLMAATVSGADAELVPTVAETFAVTSVPPV